MAGFSSGAEESGVGYNAVHCGLSPVPQHCVHSRDMGKTSSPIKLQQRYGQDLISNKTSACPEPACG